MSLNLFSLEGKTALITGSSQGIGLALAQGMARAGAHVIINGRTKDKLFSILEEFERDGLSASSMCFDVTDSATARAAFDEYEADIGPIDIVVNNAGMQHRSPLEEFPDEAFEKLLQTNITSVFQISKIAAAHMIKRGKGKIINISSVNAALARQTIAPYTATKGAVSNLTKGMAADWAKYGLQCNAIAPGYFLTPLNKALSDDPDFSNWLTKRTPAGRWGNVDELAGACIFLAADASSFVNGHTLFVDGGLTVSV